MSLLAEAKRVAAEFDFTDDDVRAIGDEFVTQMSACNLLDISKNLGY
jgi:hexokinase